VRPPPATGATRSAGSEGVGQPADHKSRSKACLAAGREESHGPDCSEESKHIEAVRNLLVEADDLGEGAVEESDPATGKQFVALSALIDRRFDDLQTLATQQERRLAAEADRALCGLLAVGAGERLDRRPQALPTHPCRPRLIQRAVPLRYRATWQPGQAEIAAEGGAGRRPAHRRGRADASIARSSPCGLAAPLPYGAMASRDQSRGQREGTPGAA
jgi:hypothetical protein